MFDGVNPVVSGDWRKLRVQFPLVDDLPGVLVHLVLNHLSILLVELVGNRTALGVNLVGK